MYKYVETQPTIIRLDRSLRRFFVFFEKVFLNRSLYKTRPPKISAFKRLAEL